MLLSLLIIVVHRGKRNLGTGDKLGRIFRDVFGTKDIDGTGVIGQVEVAVSSVDSSTDRSGKLVIGTLVRSGDELGHSLGRSVFIIIATTTGRLTVQGIEVCIARHSFGSVAAVVHQLAANNHFVPHLDISARFVLFVSKVQNPVAVKLIILGSVFGDVEGSISISTALTKGSCVCNPGNLTLYEDIAYRFICVVIGPRKILNCI